MHRMKLWFPILLTASFLVGSLSAGTKEEIIRLQSDILQLQEQIRLLQKGVDEKQGSLVSLLEQLNDQSGHNRVLLEDLQKEVRGSGQGFANLQQGLAELREDVQTLSLKLDETNNRIAAVLREVNESRLQVQTLRTPPGGAEAELEPDRVYSATYNDYLIGNYALAIAGFQDFLSKFPDHEFADNAAYYLGDSYLQQGRIDLALQAFDQVINLYPKGDKAPVAYYKKGRVLLEQQRLEEAKQVFERLRKLYPKSQEAALAETELKQLTAP